MDKDLESQLYVAVHCNYLASLETVLSKEEVKRSGYLNRSEWKNGKDPLHLAAQYGRDDMIRMLVEAGVDVNCYSVWDSKERWTALHWAVYRNRLSSVRLLLKLGADAELPGRIGTLSGTALDWARKLKYSKEITKLLEQPRGKVLVRKMEGPILKTCTEG